MANAAPSPRLTQAERSARTRGLLLDAAVESLAELGYAATTTTEVARRAGVSRGAQLHHFPTRADLLAAALEETFERRMAEIVTAIESAPPGADRMTVAMDTLWQMFGSGQCDAWIELSVAARHDPELAALMRDINVRHRAGVEAVFSSTVPSGGQEGLFYEVGAKFLLALLDGLVLQRMSGYDDDPGRSDAVVDAAKALARIAFPPPLP